MKPVINHIRNKTFLNYIEKMLLEENSNEANLTFEVFDTIIWHFLCGLKWNEKVRLTNQLTKPFEINSKVNIGNLRLQIYNDLNINFMIN